MSKKYMLCPGDLTRIEEADDINSYGCGKWVCDCIDEETAAEILEKLNNKE